MIVFVPAAIAVLSGVVLWFWNAPAPLTAVRLYRAPEMEISDLLGERPNRACFVGTVVDADSLVHGPFSGGQAVALSYEVLEEAPSFATAGRNPFETVARGGDAMPFMLDDGTGQLRVDPRGARSRLAVDTEIGVLGGTEPPERIKRFIDADAELDDENVTVNIGPLDLTGGYDRKYVERRVEPGDKVLVCGVVEDARSDVGAVPAELAGGTPFLLADSSKSTVARSLFVGNPFWAVVSLGLIGLGIWLLAVAAGVV